MQRCHEALAVFETATLRADNADEETMALLTQN
jgi:hypothetical protein